MDLIVSGNDYQLKNEAKDRIGYSYEAHLLYTEVEYSLCKLIEKELELVRDIEIIISDLKTRFDFDVNLIFGLLDLNVMNVIGRDK